MKLFKRFAKTFALAIVILLIPVAALAATGSFTSSTTTPAVKGVNSSGSTGAAAVEALESNGGSTTRYGVHATAQGPGGIGVGGAGAKFGVYSYGNIGVRAGNSIVCSGCVTAGDLSGAAKAQFVQGGGKALNGRLTESTSSGNSNVLIIPGLQSVEASCGSSGATGFRIFSRNLTNPSAGGDISWTTEGVSHYFKMTGSGTGTYLAFDVGPDRIITAQVYNASHVITITVSAHWEAGGCTFAAQAIVQ